MTEGMVGPAPPAADPGHKYEILRVVNRGGMGEIALARVKGSKGFEKLVVLKRLRADAERDDHREMFDVEAEVMSRIEHPNIVQVFDQPRIDGIQYLAMAYVRGRNLDQVIRRTRQQSARISPGFTLTVMGEVLRGLAFVHRLKDESGRALGVVHQDITPSNILVSFFGETKLTDFGIAYVTSRDGGRRSGVLKGKPRYVSPEVLAGKRVNNRADIYGAGVVLYEMLAGRALFARPSLEETLAAVARNELPDFKVVFPGLSEGVFSILSRSLAKDPNDRYRTAEEMHADVAAELGKLGGVISPPRVGYLLRQWFSGDPDVPEVDPTLDAALSEPTPAVAAPAPNLDQTLSELERLMGGETASADLFQLPPELQRELDGLADMEPFQAATPIPEIALSGPNGEELLLRGMGIRALDPPDAQTGRSISPPSSWAPPPNIPPPSISGIRPLPIAPLAPGGARISTLGTPSPSPTRSSGPPGTQPAGSTPRPPGLIPSVPGLIAPNPGRTPTPGFTPHPLTSPSPEEEDGLSRSVTGAARRAQLRASRGEYRVTPRVAPAEMPNVTSADPPPARQREPEPKDAAVDATPVVPVAVGSPVASPPSAPASSIHHAAIVAIPPAAPHADIPPAAVVPGPITAPTPLMNASLDARPPPSFAAGIAIGAVIGAIAATAASFLLLR